MITELHYNHMTVPQCLLPLRDVTQNWNLKFFIQSNKIRHNCSKDNLWPTTWFTCQINQSFRVSNNIEKALSKYCSVPDVHPNWEKQLQLINVFVVLWFMGTPWYAHSSVRKLLTAKVTWQPFMGGIITPQIKTKVAL